MCRNSCISLLLLLASFLGCSGSDPCAGQSGTCLSINVEGSIALDTISFSLTGAVQDSAMRNLPAGDTSLPVQVAVLLPATAQGALTINAVATKGGQTVGQGTAMATVTPGAHAQTVLDLQQVNNTCADGIRDGSETDVDCGGSVCKPCANGQTCSLATDCQGNVCNAGKCLAASCTDGILDDNETDVDCGGPLCGPCANGKKCALSRDCLSTACAGNTCTPAMISLSPAPLMPSNGPTTGGLTVSIAGTGFLTGLKVMLSGTAARSVAVTSQFQAQFILPLGTFGLADLTVTDPDGSTATATKAFSYFYGMLNFAAAQNFAAGLGPSSVQLPANW